MFNIYASLQAIASYFYSQKILRKEKIYFPKLKGFIKSKIRVLIDSSE